MSRIIRRWILLVCVRGRQNGVSRIAVASSLRQETGEGAFSRGRGRGCQGMPLAGHSVSGAVAGDPCSDAAACRLTSCGYPYQWNLPRTNSLVA